MNKHYWPLHRRIYYDWRIQAGSEHFSILPLTSTFCAKQPERHLSNDRHVTHGSTNGVMRCFLTASRNGDLSQQSDKEQSLRREYSNVPTSSSALICLNASQGYILRSGPTVIRSIPAEHWASSLSSRKL